MHRFKIAFCAILLLARVAWAAESDECAATATASDVRLDLFLAAGQVVFHQGEMIPVALAYTAAEPHRYWRDDPGAVQYCVEPSARDPLEVHFKGRAIMGGGLFSWRDLSEKPSIAEATLNDRFKFAPGHYRVYAVSSSVWRAAAAGEQAADDEMFGGRIHQTVRSNTVEFEVRASSAQWQQQQLESAVAVLQGTAKPDDAKHAARVLRFLDTKASVRELARMLAAPQTSNGLSQEFSNGLYASSYPDLAVDAMRKVMAMPESAVSGEYLETLVEFEEDAEGHAEPPVFDHVDPEAAQSYWQREQKQREALMQAAIEDALEALPRKQGVARAITLSALISERGADAAFIRELRPALIAGWKDLPRDTQQQLVEFRWEQVAGPEMLPILRAIIAGPAPPDRSMPADLRNAAIQHINELDPVEGHALMVRELMNPKAELSLSLIKLLSADEISSAVPAAVDRIAHVEARSLDYDLVDRYGDASELGAVEAAWEPYRRLPACGPQPKLLRYFLRVAPDYGAEQVRAAMAIREDNGCYKYLLQALGDRIPAAQESAIEALDDADPDVVQDAAIALGRWGTADAEGPLWTHLERLHSEWAGHENEIRITPESTSPGSRAYALEQALTNALGGGSGWISTPGELARLRQLIVTGQDRDQVDRWTAEWKDGPLRIEPQWFPEDALSFSVLGSVQLTEDQLAAKLAQFPRGTRLVWPVWKPGQIAPPVALEKQHAVFLRLKAVADEHGLAMTELIQP